MDRLTEFIGNRIFKRNRFGADRAIRKFKGMSGIHSASDLALSKHENYQIKCSG